MTKLADKPEKTTIADTDQVYVYDSTKPVSARDFRMQASTLRGNLAVTNFAGGVVDTDGTLAGNSDTKLATQKAVKTYADNLLAANDAMIFKGVIDCSGNPNYPAADRGWTYRVSVAGKIGGASGVNVEAGDILTCLTDGTAAGDQATVGANWAIVQTNIDGAVTTTGVQTLSNKTLSAPVVTGTMALSGGQIAFPAAQSASADPNTLDDYEEGTFTPTIIGTGSAGAGTYSVQRGRYTKIGRMVQFDVELTWSAHTGTTNMKVSGLPFALAATYVPSFQIVAENLTFTGQLVAQGDAGASTITIGVVATGAALAALAIDTAATVRISGSYCV